MSVLVTFFLHVLVSFYLLFLIQSWKESVKIKGGYQSARSLES